MPFTIPYASSDGERAKVRCYGADDVNEGVLGEGDVLGDLIIDEAHAAVDGKLGDLIKEKAEALGLHIIGFEESGFRNTFSTKPIQTMADFKGVTIRTMENKYHQAAFWMRPSVASLTSSAI